MRQRLPKEVHPVAMFWKTATFMKDRPEAWLPTGGYELRQRVKIQRKWWTICFKVHLVPELDESRANWLGLSFSSTVTIWPPKLSDQESGWFKRQGGYRTFEKRLREHGYDGAWQTTPGVGQWANFEKALPDFTAVRDEAKVLEGLSQACGEDLGSIGAPSA